MRQTTIFHWCSVERSNTTRTETRKDRSRTIWRMPRQILHVINILWRIKKRYFDNHSISLYKLQQCSCIMLQQDSHGSSKFIRQKEGSTKKKYMYTQLLQKRPKINWSYHQWCQTPHIDTVGNFQFMVLNKTQATHQWYGVLSQAYHLIVILRKHTDWQQQVRMVI